MRVQARVSQRNRYATSTHHTRDTAGIDGHCMAVAVETTSRTAAGRYRHRAGEFPALLSPDYGAGSIPFPVTAMVVVPKITTAFEEDK